MSRGGGLTIAARVSGGELTPLVARALGAASWLALPCPQAVRGPGYLGDRLATRAVATGTGSRSRSVVAGARTAVAEARAGPPSLPEQAQRCSSKTNRMVCFEKGGGMGWLAFFGVFLLFPGGVVRVRQEC